MSEYQVTYWRDLPTMITARDGADVVKVQLAARFQEAVDEAAMRLGDTGAEDYLAGWTRSAWTASSEGPQATLDRVAADLDGQWSAEKIADYLDALGPAAS